MQWLCLLLFLFTAVIVPVLALRCSPMVRGESLDVNFLFCFVLLFVLFLVLFCILRWSRCQSEERRISGLT